MGLFDFITKPFESALTPAGTHAAASQGSRQSAVAKDYGQLAHEALGQDQNWLGLLKNLHLNGAFGTALNDLTAGPDQSIKNFAAGATENAANNSRQLALTLRSLGFQDGATQGATQGQFQNAATQTNQFATQQMSPEHIQSVIQALLSSLQGGSQLFGGNAAQAAQGVYGQPQVQVQPNYLANALGQAAGAYAGKH